MEFIFPDFYLWTWASIATRIASIVLEGNVKQAKAIWRSRGDRLTVDSRVEEDREQNFTPARFFKEFGMIVAACLLCALLAHGLVALLLPTMTSF